MCLSFVDNVEAMLEDDFRFLDNEDSDDEEDEWTSGDPQSVEAKVSVAL